MQNLMLNGLEPVSNPKNKKRKSSFHFSNCPFSSWDNFSLKSFFLYLRQCKTVEKFFLSQPVEKKQAASGKKIYLEFSPKEKTLEQKKTLFVSLCIY